MVVPISVEPLRCDPCRTAHDVRSILVLHAALPPALAQATAPPSNKSIVRLPGRPRVVRLRCELDGAAGERTWLLEIDVDVPAVDPERILAECEDFLVDGTDGRRIGVVDSVERGGRSGGASALLISAGWFGRRRLRVDAHAVEALVPAERLVIVDESRVRRVGGDRRAS